MKKIIFAYCFLIFSSALFAQCKVKTIVKKNMPSLAPYQYDAYAVQEIVYGAKAKKESLEFAVYSGEDYKLVFCKTELPQEVSITIYDDNPKKKTSKIVYMDESGKKDQYVCNFHPTKTGSCFIQYDVPPATASGQQGCFVVLIGVKE